MSFTIDAMREGDLPAVAAVGNAAFEAMFKTLLGKVPPGKGEGDRVAQRYLRPDCHGIVAREPGGRVLGFEFLQRCGSRGTVGPLAVHPDAQATGAGQALMEGIVEVARDLGCSYEVVTFPHSPMHFEGIFRYLRMTPLFPTPFFVKVVRSADALAGGRLRVTWYRALGDEEAARALESLRLVTDRFFPGYDITPEVLHVAERGLGDTVLAFSGDTVVGGAVCHYGPGCEAFTLRQLLIKLLEVDPTLAPDLAREAFTALLTAAEARVVESGQSSVALMVSGGRRATVEALFERGYSIHQMHQHFVYAGDGERNLKAELAAIQPDQYAAAEWR